MAVLTNKELREQFNPSKTELDKYFKDNPKITRNKKTERRAKAKLRATKIKWTPGKEVSFTQSAAPWQVVYGRQRIGGVITFAHTSGRDHRYLHLVITLAGHEITSIEKLFFDEEEVVFFTSPDPKWSDYIIRKDGTHADAGNKIYMSPNLGYAGNPAEADLANELPEKWTADHKQDHCAHVYIKIEWNVKLFSNGMPDITFEILGKPVKLPNGTTTYSSNAAAVIRDYMTDTRYGLAIPEADIDATYYSDAYDKCDEIVSTLSGDEARYTIDGTFSTSDAQTSILEAMTDAMGGSVIYVNGTWKILPAQWIAPTLTLTEEDILSDIRIQTKFSRSDSFNGVRGTFISPGDGWEETDFPPVKNDYYMSLDNGERSWLDVQYLLSMSPYRSQRLAKIELERNRQAISVQFTASLKAYQLQPLDVVYLTIDRYGWTAKPFEVQKVGLSFDGGGGDDAPAIQVDLYLQETAEGVFEWNAGQETPFDLSDNTDLPNPLSTDILQNVELASGTSELYVRADGTVFSRIKVSWDSPEDFFVTSGGSIEIQFKRSADILWQTLTDTPGDIQIAYILDVQDNVDYDVRIRAKNALGIAGDWVTIEHHEVQGKTEAPSNVQGFTGAVEPFGIRFSWTNVSDFDVNSYELRIGTVGSSWETAARLAVVSGNTYFASLKFTDDYWFFIKAVDTSNNYSLEATKLVSSITGPEITAPRITLIQEKYLLQWDTPDSLFAVDSYDVSYGATYAARTFIANIRGLTFSDVALWGGVRTFWVVAIDVAGNYGEPGAVSINIAVPSVVTNLSTQILDQNVLLRWQAPVGGSLPVSHYLVYKGDVFATATLVGQTSGTFSALFEIAGGTFTYWVSAVDVAGNIGVPAAATVIVQPPVDFVLIETGDPQDPARGYILPSTGTGVNFSTENELLILPVEVTETWNNHFQSNGLLTTQDAVDDGLTYLIQPVPLNGYWSRVLDYGTTIDSALVTLDFVKETFDGTPTVITSIAYSLNGTDWTEQIAPQLQVYATNFRYVRIAFQIGEFGDIAGAMSLSTFASMTAFGEEPTLDAIGDLDTTLSNASAAIVADTPTEDGVLETTLTDAGMSASATNGGTPTATIAVTTDNVTADFDATYTGTFAPDSITQIAGWWETQSNCYETANTTLAVNNDLVAQLQDSSTNARHMSASTKPTYLSAGINSIGALQFNGSATIQSGNHFIYSIHHLFAVIIPNGADQDIIGSDNPNNGDILIQIDSSRKLKGHIWTSAGAQVALHGTTLNDGTIYLIEQWVDATTINVAVNGGSPVTTTLVGTHAGSTRPIVLGSRYANSGSVRFAGKMGEPVLFTTTDITSGERSDMIDYLRALWNFA